MEKVRRDSELLAIYEQYKRDYDEDSSEPVKGGKEEKGSETGLVHVEKHEQNHCEELQDNDDDNESYYDRFYVRHYDPERKKQKLERKRGLTSSKTCDGKIEHTIDEKDIRPEIAQALRSRKSS